MLTRFSVENFRTFRGPLTLDLGSPGNYAFNHEAIYQGIVSKAIVYGFNGCGKSNLGLAISDIVTHLTDNERVRKPNELYRNLNNSPDTPATFEYFFLFDGSEVFYRYQKSDADTLICESLSIDGREVISYDYMRHEGAVYLDGAESLKNLNAKNSGISRVKFVAQNAILSDTHDSAVFQLFIDFVEHMLLFYSLDGNGYQGFKSGNDDIGGAIIKAGRTREFERFLLDNNVQIQLAEREVNGEQRLMARFQDRDVPFFQIVSTGTKSLSLFYFWYIMMEKASFVFMDEFDAFYHFELASNIVRLLKPLAKTQVIFTTHNTDLLSNDLLRPDCYFWLDNETIRPLCALTEKDLRKAHNLQKMFKAGAFRG